MCHVNSLGSGGSRISGEGEGRGAPTPKFGAKTYYYRKVIAAR